MKKLILILILLVSFGSYSQTSTKKCDCCKSTKVIPKKKKPIKKKSVIVKPIIAPVPPCSTVNNTIINNTINNYPQTETKVVCKDTVIKIVEVVKPPVKDVGPEFEVYAGIVNPKYISNLGYMIGFNFMPNLHQIGKNGKPRDYLNKYLFGFEFSGYQSGEHVVEIQGTTTAPVTTKEDCHCESTTFGGYTSGTKYSYKENVLGLSINFGVEIYRGWYLTTGVTSYKNRYILNGQTASTSYSTFIDAGVKKFFKVGNVYLSPMVKFNEQTSSFGLGFSYD